MTTSYTQFQIMVEFMERNGDLSQPSGGPRGPEWCNKKWQELTAKLNIDGNGQSGTEEKWRKVWSDFKKNTEKKYAKINKAARGGGPALRVTLTDVEERVMRIMREQAATGLAIPEAGLQDQMEIQTTEDLGSGTPITIPDADVEQPTTALSYIGDSDWNVPGTSSQPTVISSVIQQPHDVEHGELQLGTSTSQRVSSPPPKKRPSSQKRKPPPKKIKKNENSTVDTYTNAFFDAEKRARDYKSERDKMFFELEKERIRQRDMELHLQAQWQEFLKEALNVIRNIMEAKKGMNE